jgi:hypothetical protein
MLLRREDGWMEWAMMSPALADAPVQVMREGWEKPLVIIKAGMDGDTNLADLYWKRTGIYRELEAKIHPAALAQLESCCGGYSGMLGSLFGGILGVRYEHGLG